MTNAERIVADIGFVVGQYERLEMTAHEAVMKINSLARDGCKHCAYDGKCFADGEHSCSAGYLEFLKQSAE